MTDPSLNHQKKSSNVLKIIIPLIVILLGVFIYLNVNASPNESNIEGVSDEVYEQIVEQYFFIDTFMERSKGSDTSLDWIEEHNLFDEAKEYAEANEDVPTPLEAFPNPLLIKYNKDPNAYSKTEQAHIDQLKEYIEAFQRKDNEKFETLKMTIKKEFHIKESYNMFE